MGMLGEGLGNLSGDFFRAELLDCCPKTKCIKVSHASLAGRSFLSGNPLTHLPTPSKRRALHCIKNTE